MMHGRMSIDGKWIATDGDRWWRVTYAHGRTTIRNERQQSVSPTGVLGTRILKAIAIAKQRTR